MSDDPASPAPDGGSRSGDGADAGVDPGGDGDERGDEEGGADADDVVATGAGPRSRDVVVPFEVYKTVTVFSTLFAVFAVVAGFVVIDRATRRASLPLSEVDPVLSIAGIGLIVLGAATYAFSTRFRTAEMGKSNEESDELSDNG